MLKGNIIFIKVKVVQPACLSMYLYRLVSSITLAE